MSKLLLEYMVGEGPEHCWQNNTSVGCSDKGRAWPLFFLASKKLGVTHGIERAGPQWTACLHLTSCSRSLNLTLSLQSSLFTYIPVFTSHWDLCWPSQCFLLGHCTLAYNNFLTSSSIANHQKKWKQKLYFERNSLLTETPYSQSL